MFCQYVSFHFRSWVRCTRRSGKRAESASATSRLPAQPFPTTLSRTVRVVLLEEIKEEPGARVADPALRDGNRGFQRLLDRPLRVDAHGRLEVDLPSGFTQRTGEASDRVILDGAAGMIPGNFAAIERQVE